MDKAIGIDVYSALHSPRGMGSYTINLLKELAKIDKETKYILYSDVEDEKNVLPKQDNFELKILSAKGLFNYEQFVLPKQCKKDGIYALHSPANTSPIFLDKRIKRIITLHDIIFLKKEIPLPNNKKQLLGRFYYSLCTILNANKADRIFTVSQFSKNDIANMFHINDDKFAITPNGNEHIDNSKVTPFEELKNKYGFADEYYFTLGGEAPSKNTELLLKVFSENPDKNLVVAGIKNLDNSLLYSKYKLYSNIKFVPYIEQAELVGIYKNTQAFIFPSIYEGFGIPLLEAMKCGCPIICSNATCLPEVAGDAALYFNPKDRKEILDKIKELSNNNDLRQELIQKGKERLKLFSWAKTAEVTLEIYKNI